MTPIVTQVENPVYKVHYERVRDNIIAFARKNWKAEEWCGPFCKHMTHIGWNKLDSFNELAIKLPDKRVLRFTTTLYKGSTFTYTIDSYDAEAPVELKKKTFLGFEV
jgi:hypothetical protein